ncbi:MAG: LamG domain-containing protein, partial [Verrucomicrobia bacterium]|nr:LamG domain-containing protein [Verrucomicrobiota bacterium]
GGLYLDGTTGSGSTYVTIPNAPSLRITNAISFAAWVRCDDTGRDAPILDKEGPGKLSYWFGAFPTAHFGVLLATDTSGSWAIQDRNQGSIPQGVWVHLVSTWDGTTIRHYLNGVQLQETAAFSGPIIASDAALIIGANVPFNNTAFNGVLDDLQLYNHALSPAEIAALAGTTPQLVGHWTFDEGGGTNILDASGLANHGTLINPQTNTWTTGMHGGGLYFAGVVGTGSTYVAIPDALSLRIAGDISFAAWVRCDDINRDAPILAKEGEGRLSYWFGAFGLSNEGGGPGDFGVLLDADGNQPWTLYNRDQGTIPQGQWVHLASVREGSTVHHYLNGVPLAHTGTFKGPIHISDAFVAIGVNSLYNFAANHTAFKGAVDEVYLYNYALSAADVRALYLDLAFRIISVAQEGEGVRLTWACEPGRSYVVQTNAVAGGGSFVDLTAAIATPADYAAPTTNFLHQGVLRNSGALYYRVKLLP